MYEPPVIRVHQDSSGFIRVHQAIRRTSRPSAVRIPTARPDDASNSTRDTCVLSFSWQPACFVSPRTRALTMAAVPVGRARRRGEHLHSAARLVHDDAIEAHSAWKVGFQRRLGEISGDRARSGEIRGDQLTSAWEVKMDAGTVEVTQHVSHQGRGCVRHRRPLQSEAGRWGDQGRSGAIRGDQGPCEAIRVHSVVIRGDQTCSRKQIMSSCGVIRGIRPAAGSRSCRANCG